MLEIINNIPDYVVPLTVFGLILLAGIFPALMGILSSTLEVGWIMRKRKFGESEQDYFIRLWSMKEDKEILVAYEDATGWVDLSLGIVATPTVIDIADDCTHRLEIYILPEMKKRNLSYK